MSAQEQPLLGHRARLPEGARAEPPAPLRDYNRTIDLERLQRIADAIIADEEIPANDPDAQQAHELLGGTSMGGRGD